MINLQLFETLNRGLIEHRTGVKGNLVGARYHHGLSEYATKNALGQGLDDIATLNQRRHRHTLAGVTVHLGNHQVLGDVNQTTCQVTGVGCLQSGVGKAFASAVSRDEVLQYVQPLTEVRRDRRFDD